MSDTVKLIIEIPKDYYEIIKHEVDVNHYPYRPFAIIANGTPIDDVKAEIAEEICLTENPYTKETKYTIEHLKLLEILDNIGKESEDKE